MVPGLIGSVLLSTDNKRGPEEPNFLGRWRNIFSIQRHNAALNVLYSSHISSLLRDFLLILHPWRVHQVFFRNMFCLLFLTKWDWLGRGGSVFILKTKSFLKLPWEIKYFCKQQSSRVIPLGPILLLLMKLSWFKVGCFPLLRKSHKILQLALKNTFFCISLFPLKSYPNWISLPFETLIKLKRSGVANKTEECFFNVQRKSIIQYLWIQPKEYYCSFILFSWGKERLIVF